MAYTSTLLRAKQTATTILTGKMVTLETKHELQEINHGDWEGLTEHEVETLYHKQWYLWQSQPSKAIKPNGETLQDVCDRIIPAWQNIISYGSPKTVLVVSHKVTIQVILTHLCGLSLDSIFEFPMDNCAINIIDYPKGCQGMAELKVTNLSTNWLPVAA